MVFGLSKDYDIIQSLVPPSFSLRHLFRFLLPFHGRYDLLSFFPFSFEKNQPKSHGEKESETKYVFTKNKMVCFLQED